MLRIISMTMTVLPTPPPPKSPIFEPLEKVQMRSMTLIPVSRISVSVDCSEMVGAVRCIGIRPSPANGPLPSMVSPMTLNIRPSVASPTGTWIGAPVARTASPRRTPSVVSMAMVRTVLLPRLCCTSSTSRLPSSRSISSASRISGRRSPLNSTSTTGPITCTTAPVPDCNSTTAISLSSAFKRRGAGDDLHQLCRDRRLPHLVGGEGQVFDELACVVGRIAHRNHACGLLGCPVLQHGSINLRLDISGQQRVEHILGVGLVLEVGAHRFRIFRWDNGDDPLQHRLLAADADETRVHDVDLLHLAALVLLHRNA